MQDNPARFDRKKAIKRLFIAILFSAAGFFIVFSIFSWQEVTTDFSIPRPLFFVPAVLVLGVSWTIDAFRIMVTVRAWKKRISLLKSYQVVLSGYFFGGISPANSGRGPAEIYVLTRAGMSVGEAASLIAICGILYQIALILLFFLLFVGSPIELVISNHLLNLIYTFFLVYSVAIGALFFCIRWPKPVLKLTGKVLDWLEHRLPRYNLSREKYLGWVENFLKEFSEGFTILFRRKPGYLFFNLALQCAYYLTLFWVAHFVILALGSYSSLSTVIRLQIPVFFTYGLVPTPGASGGVELALTSTFSSILEAGRITTFVFYWRILTYYLTLAVGGLAFFRTVDARR